MATKTFEELKQLAIQIRDEKTNKQNTATRIGTQMLEHLDKLEQDYYDKTATNEELQARDEKLTELESKYTSGIIGNINYNNLNYNLDVEGDYKNSFNVLPFKEDGYLIAFKIELSKIQGGAQIVPFTIKYDGNTTTSEYNEIEIIDVSEKYVDSQSWIKLENIIEVKKGYYFGVKLVNCAQKGIGNRLENEKLVGINDDGSYRVSITKFICKNDYYVSDNLVYNEAIKIENIDKNFGNVGNTEYEQTDFDSETSGNDFNTSFNVTPFHNDGYLFAFRIGLCNIQSGAKIVPFTIKYNGDTTTSDFYAIEVIDVSEKYIDSQKWVKLSKPFKVKKGYYFGVRVSKCNKIGKGNLTSDDIIVTVNNLGEYVSKLPAYRFQEDFLIFNNIEPLHELLLTEPKNMFGNVGNTEYEQTDFDSETSGNDFNTSFNNTQFANDGYLFAIRIGLCNIQNGAQIVPFTIKYDGNTTTSEFYAIEIINVAEKYTSPNSWIKLSQPFKVGKGYYFGIRVVGCNKVGKGSLSSENKIINVDNLGNYVSAINGFKFQEDFMTFSEIMALHNYLLNENDNNFHIDLKLSTNHAEVLPKMKKFLAKLNDMQKNDTPYVTTIVGLGDSIWALTDMNSKIDNPQLLPPRMTAYNIVTRVYNNINKPKPSYYRYDSGIFNENGDFKTINSKNQGYNWYDIETSPSVETRVGVSSNCSISFVTPNYTNFCFIDRLCSEGVNCTVICENGKLEVLQDDEWVEANGYTFSQLQPSGDYMSNTTYQRRIYFRKKTQENISVTIQSDNLFMTYWGIECYSRNCVRLINSGHGGRRIQDMVGYLANDVYSHNPNLILFEIPLLNMIPGLTEPNDLNKLLDKIIYGDGRNGSDEYDLSFAKKSNNFENFQILYVIPNFAQDYYNGNEETNAPLANGYTRMDFYRQAVSYLNYNDLPYINVAESMLQYYYQTKSYKTIKDIVLGSGVDGDTFTNEGIHPNDKGALIASNEINIFNY